MARAFYRVRLWGKAKEFDATSKRKRRKAERGKCDDWVKWDDL